MALYIFSTRFECSFQIYGLEARSDREVTLLGKSKSAFPVIEGVSDDGKTILETSGEDVKLHSKRVEKM